MSSVDAESLIREENGKTLQTLALHPSELHKTKSA